MWETSSECLAANSLDKLSLLRAITGEQPLSFGSIAFNDKNLDSMTPYYRAKQGIGYLPHRREIFPLLPARKTSNPVLRP